MWSISQPEVLAEEAGDEPERQEDRRDHDELLDHRVETLPGIAGKAIRRRADAKH
jgi:hypothetical protein